MNSHLRDWLSCLDLRVCAPTNTCHVWRWHRAPTRDTRTGRAKHKQVVSPQLRNLSSISTDHRIDFLLWFVFARCRWSAWSCRCMLVLLQPSQVFEQAPRRTEEQPVVKLQSRDTVRYVYDHLDVSVYRSLCHYNVTSFCSFEDSCVRLAIGTN